MSVLTIYCAQEPEPPAPTVAKASDAGVSSKELADLKSEMARLKGVVEGFKKTFESEIERMENELDEEKKERMKLQVEVERLRRKNPVQ